MSKTAVVKERPTQAGPPALGSTIRVVSKRTGLTMDTLRVWERRYGFPAPDRREDSNRRLYAEADVAKLVAMARAIDHGYRVGDVVAKSVEEILALTGLPLGDAPQVGPVSGVADLIDLLERDQIVDLEDELRRLAATLGPRRFIVDIAHPFAVAVGVAWVDGRIAVRHEHVATECLTTQMRHMLMGFQDIDARPRVLLATLPGEPHTLALDMVALYLAVSGAKPRLLGGSTPPDQVVDGVWAFSGDAVGITVATTADRNEMRRGLAAVARGLPPTVPLWVGGGGAEGLSLDPCVARVTTSWQSIDDAVAEWRQSMPSGPARSSRR